MLLSAGRAQVRIPGFDFSFVPRPGAGAVPDDPALPLPDTVYASARSLAYEVERCDTVCATFMRRLRGSSCSVVRPCATPGSAGG